jgi:glycosidase
MAVKTDVSLRNKTIYQIFVRQFSKTHDFLGVIEKLDLIKSQNIDVVYLLPINTIGLDHRKGEIGSPYSIKNYYEIDPGLGTVEDFKLLVEEIHKRDMQLMIDIVFNHTSHDADYTKKHPEWYYQKNDGSFTNRVGDWWDIIDFKFEGNLDLEDELINVLKYWVTLGVDGIRCDVAPLIPINFWKRARTEIDKLNPNFIYLSESVHLSFIKYLRDLGYDALSDSEVYQVFDICYDYDIFDDFQQYFKEGRSLSHWVESLIRQESIYPKNYVKLRFLENHDMERIGKFITTESQYRNVNTMLFFLKGTQMIYNGQETGAKEKPDLFEYDEIDWTNYNFAGIAVILRKMSGLKKELNYLNGVMYIELLSNNVIEFKYELKDKIVVGIFNLSDDLEKVLVKYSGTDFLTNKTITNGIQEVLEPIVFIINK